jgi:hypothetical protein
MTALASDLEGDALPVSSSDGPSKSRRAAYWLMTSSFYPLVAFIALYQMGFGLVSPDWHNLRSLLPNHIPTYIAVVLLRGFIYVMFFITSTVLYSALKDRFEPKSRASLLLLGGRIQLILGAIQAVDSFLLLAVLLNDPAAQSSLIPVLAAPLGLTSILGVIIQLGIEAGFALVWISISTLPKNVGILRQTRVIGWILTASLVYSSIDSSASPVYFLLGSLAYFLLVLASLGVGLYFFTLFLYGLWQFQLGGWILQQQQQQQ